MNVAYTAHATATGGREGHSRSDDGKVDVALTPPKELGGSGTGVNPEQLFAAGYAACYLGAIKFAAGKEKIKISDDAKSHSARRHRRARRQGRLRPDGFA
jgi:lipoyl-dependent peroxiredoxin